MAYQGIDLRDLFRRGSGLNLRRLMVLIRQLPPDASLWAAVEAAHKRSLKPTVEQIRDRQAYYAAKRQPQQ